MHVSNVLFMLKVNFEKNMVHPIQKFPSLVLLWNVTLLPHFIIQRLLYYLSSGRSPRREVKNKRKLQTFKASFH